MNEYIDYNVAMQTINEINGISDEIGQNFRNTINEIESNIGQKSVWQGAAASQFKQKWDAFTVEFTNQLNLIATLNDKALYTKNQMEQAESQMASAAASAVDQAIQ